MIQNRVRDRSRLKILILGCPKTGNAWLKSMLKFAYRLPFAGLPACWDESVAASLPDSFVAHQHILPCERLVRWIAANDVVVVTPIRHPADTLLSYFHYMRWQGPDGNPAAATMRADGDGPAAATLRFAVGEFAQAYAVSLAWARLGAIVVRYEDLLRDPVGRLGEIVADIAPLDEGVIRSAVLLCRPDLMVAAEAIDARHIKTATAGAWRTELPAAIATAMAAVEPFRTACTRFGYDWDHGAADAPLFDYATIDPFGGRSRFDNGESIGPTLMRIYLLDVPDAARRWSDPCRTDGDSFWNWLVAPYDGGGSREGSAASITNLMAAVHRQRTDLQRSLPDPWGEDRVGFTEWFIGQAVSEMKLPWALVAPVMEGFLDHLRAVAAEGGPAGQPG